MSPPRSSIPITKPVFGNEERRAVQAPLESGWVVQGPRVAEFEALFSAFTGARHAAATSSCTTALHVAVSALKLSPGEEVIVPAFTWVATANVVEYVGGRPIFCDIDLSTYNVDPAQLDDLIGPRTVGVLPVHLFGLCCDLEPIVASAARHGLWMVEDAACAFGARYRGRHAGTIGDAGCFSFHPRKSITTGEGGMLTTNRTEIDGMARILRDHGASRSDLTRHEGVKAFLLADFEHLGYNYRLTDLQGALGCAQMARADWILMRRRELAARYDELLSDLSWLVAPRVPAGYEHGYQAYVCLFRPEPPTLENVNRLHALRNQIMGRLEQVGIATRQGTHAPVALDYYKRKYDLHPEDFPNAFLADHLSLTLPLYPQMTDADQNRVVTELQRAFDRTD